MASQCVQCPQLFERRAPTSYDNIECCPHHCRDPPCDPCNKRRNCPRYWRRSSSWRHSCGCRKFTQGSARRSSTNKWSAPTTPNTIIYLLIPIGGDTVRVSVLMGSAAFRLAGRARGQYQHNLQYYLYPSHIQCILLVSNLEKSIAKSVRFTCHASCTGQCNT
jgi:hypothetical protein